MKMITLAAALTVLTTGAAMAQPPHRPNPDANGDGKVTLAEFKASRAGLLMRGDTNKDGKLSKAEAEAVTAGRGPGGPGGGGMFAMLDGNRDGFVSRAEIEQASERRFKTMDTNKDGVLSAAEREAGRGMGRPG